MLRPRVIIRITVMTVLMPVTTATIVRRIAPRHVRSAASGRRSAAAL
jgi:hypothetical protein